MSLKYFFVLLFLPVTAFAQDTLTLGKAIEKALSHNHQVKVARNNHLISENNAHIGNAGLLPTVDVQGSGNYRRENTQQDFAGGIPDSDIEGAQTKTYNASLNLSYTLFEGMGRIHDLKKLRTQAEQGEVEARLTIENTLLNVIRGFYETARLQGQYEIARENAELSADRVKRAQNRFQYGKANKMEVLNAQVDLDADSSSLLQAELDLNKAKRNLKVLMGEAPSSSLQVEEEVQIDQKMKRDSVLPKAEKFNAELLSASKQVDIAKMEKKIASSGNFPTLSLNSSYSYNRNESDAGIMSLNESDGFRGGLTLSYPIFNGFQQNIQEKNARIQVENQKQQLEQTKKQVRKEVLNAWENYTLQLRILSLEKRNLVTAQKNFERSRENYQYGKINATQFREAQVNLLRTRIRLNNTRYQAKLAEMELIKLQGNLIN